MSKATVRQALNQSRHFQRGGRQLRYSLPVTREESIIGCLLGTAVGDALGLSCEGLSRRRQQRMFGPVRGYHFLLGRGMISDDTEHTCLVAQSLIVSAGDERKFSKDLARRLRFWLLGLPACVGFATLRAILKSCAGLGGVFSAGNGPAMRSAILGACYGQEPQKMRALVRASARLTHTDPKAEWGALAVALAAHVEPRDFLPALENLLGTEGGEFLELIRKAVAAANAGQTTESFAAELGLGAGVSGYTYHTVPVALHAWLSHPGDYRAAVAETIACGGDADTTAAIVGGIAGAHLGKAGIPREWLEGLWEWPRTVRWMEELGKRLADSAGLPRRALPLAWYGVFPRNIFFLVVVLLHGFRRLFPPY